MKTILVADDDVKVCKLLRVMLENEGYKVLEAHGGTECLDLAQNHSPELVITDLIMPDQDGITTIKNLKQANQNVKVIAMTGGLVLTPEPYLLEAKGVGADMVLTKPVRRDDLLNAIELALID